jgi:hypothetical protein
MPAPVFGLNPTLPLMTPPPVVVIVVAARIVNGAAEPKSTGAGPAAHVRCADIKASTRTRINPRTLKIFFLFTDRFVIKFISNRKPGEHRRKSAHRAMLAWTKFYFVRAMQMVQARFKLNLRA